MNIVHIINGAIDFNHILNIICCQYLVVTMIETFRYDSVHSKYGSNPNIEVIRISQCSITIYNKNTNECQE